MSKFNNPSRALATGLAQPAVAGVLASGAAAFMEPATAAWPEAETASSQSATPQTKSFPESALIGTGFFLLCVMLLSGEANDISFHLLGNKAYISTVVVVLVPAVWLVSGNALRGLKFRMGYWWIALLAFMLASIPFSVYRRGSFDAIETYIVRAYCLFFYICAFTTTLRRCRALMYTSMAASGLVLATCILFGSTDTGRFVIANSIFFTNSNELALELVLAISQFLYVFYGPGIFKRALGILGIIGSAIYLSKTESRGCMLAAVALLVAIVFLSKNRVFLGIIAVLIVMVSLAAMPKRAIGRFAVMFSDAPTTQAQAASLASTLQREDLLKKSLRLTVTHPLFGVGAGQFPVAVAGEAAKNHDWAPWLGTHNSYTQISSECGIPAFICYCAILGICMKKNLRVYRAAARLRLRDVEGLAFCLFAGALAYAIGTFFFHMAYTGSLPILAGFTVCLEAVAQPLLAAGKSQAVPAGPRRLA